MSTFLIFGDIFLSVLILTSFPDAEAREDGGEEVGGGDGAEDGAEEVEGLAEVLGYEVAGKGGVDALDDAAYREGGFVEGLGVAKVCDDDFALVESAEGAGGGDQLAAQGVGAFACLGAKADCGDAFRGDEVCAGGYVCLVDGCDDACFAADAFDCGVILRLHGARGVEQGDDDVGGADGSVGAFDAELFDGVVGISNAGGVDEAEAVFAHGDGVFDCVARGAVYVADYGAFFAE